jgi:perosamine synthetase
MIKHSKPTIVEEKKLLKIIDQILRTVQLAEGQYTDLFEKELCKFFGSKYAVSVSSGSAALHLALLSLGVEKNSEVIIPAFCCYAVLNSVLYCGARPVIVDVNPDEFNLSYEEVKKNISKKTKAIILPHMFGYPAKDTQKIVSLGIPVIEDTAQSIGAKINGKLVGSFGKINVLSFYATKMITTFGEGGAVLTNDKNLYKKIKSLKSYDKNVEFELRYNYKITEVQSAMGIIQLKYLAKFVEKRKKIFEIYKKELKNCNNIKIFEPEGNIEAVYYRFIIQLKNKVDLDKIICKFKEHNIEVAKPVFLPLDKYYYGRFVCQNSKNFYYTTISLPLYPELTETEVKKISNVLKKILCTNNTGD